VAERVELWKAKDGYRWRRIAVNEQQISESGEGYVSKLHVIEMARDLNPGVPIFDIEVSELAADE
jgi:uncharacterized protein YegP (UPF0339 family)